MTFVTRTNWILFIGTSLAGLFFTPLKFALGILLGGLIVTVNFHLLARTLRSALTPPHLSSHHVVIAKYYVRFIISGIIIFFLISKHFVNPLGLFIGLSVVVASIVMAALFEIKNLIVKEAV
ncbi:MAG: ATP synthase subunit I [Desulfobacterales bacterium]